MILFVLASGFLLHEQYLKGVNAVDLAVVG